MAYTFGTCSAPNPVGNGMVDTYEEGSSCTLKTLEDCDGNVAEVRATGKRKIYRWSIIGATAGDLEAGQEYGEGIITSITTRYRRGDYSVVDITVEAPVVSGGGGG